MKLTEAQRKEMNPVLVTISDAMNAHQAGDMDTFCELMRTVPIPASTLLAIKKAGNADVIREQGLNTSLADAEFGPG